MATPEPALRSIREPHIHALGETCPMCDQPIPNDKAEEVRARMETQERSAALVANTRADQQIAAEKARIEAAAGAKFEELRKEKEEALEKAAADAAIRAEAALAEGRKAAEAALQEQVAAAQKAKADAEQSAAQKVIEAEAKKHQALEQVQAIEEEKARIETAASARVEELRKDKERALEKAAADTAALAEAARAEGRKAAEAALQDQVAGAQKAKADAEQAAAQKVAEAEAKKQQALEQVQTITAEHEEQLSERIAETREALERDKAEALVAAKAASDAETRKLTDKLVTMQRQLEKQRAVELGEGAEVKLFDDLKAAFPSDNIRRVQRGASGADILHTVIHNGQDCGTIVYDSKNTGAWRNDYIAKLISDQTVAKADHAILSTLKFPAGASQLEVRDGVVVVNPARAVAIAGIIRRHMLQVRTLRLSKADRMKKMAAMYDFVTSERCTHLLERVESESGKLLDLQTAEIKAHENHWKKEGHLLRSIQKVKAELDVEFDSIIGACDGEE